MKQILKNYGITRNLILERIDSKKYSEYTFVSILFQGLILSSYISNHKMIECSELDLIDDVIFNNLDKI